MNRKRKAPTYYDVWWDEEELVWVAFHITGDGRSEYIDFAFEEDARNQIDDWKFWDKHGAIV